MTPGAGHSTRTGGSDQNLEILQSSASQILGSGGFITTELLDELKMIVDRREWPFGTMIKAYRASIPRNWHSIVIDRDPRQAMSQMLSDLRSAGVGSSPPLLEFVDRLTRDAPGTLYDDLNHWTSRIAKQIGLDITKLRDRVSQYYEPAPPTNPYLLFALRPHSRRNRYCIQAWLWTDDGPKRCLRANDDPQTLKEAEGELQELLMELIGTQELMESMSQLMIAFFLPHHLLGEAVDEWAIRVGAETEVIGTHYGVIIRSLERIYEKSFQITWPSWERKWNSVMKDQMPSVLWLCSPVECEDQGLSFKLNNIACLALAIVPPRAPGTKRPDVLLKMIEKGAPIALWLRRENFSSCHVKQSIDPILQAELAKLPEIVFQKRRAASEADFWRHITLLWDDPMRRPPIKRLEPPKKG